MYVSYLMLKSEDQNIRAVEVGQHLLLHSSVQSKFMINAFDQYFLLGSCKHNSILFFFLLSSWSTLLKPLVTLSLIIRKMPKPLAISFSIALSLSLG